MPSDDTTGNLILGAAVVAAAWFVSAPLRGASNAAGDVGGFVGNVANGVTGAAADTFEGVSGGVGDVFGGITGEAAESFNAGQGFVGGLVGGGSQIVNETLAVPGDLVKTGQDAFGGVTDFGGDVLGGAGSAAGDAVDSVTNWKFTGF